MACKHFLVAALAMGLVAVCSAQNVTNSIGQRAFGYTYSSNIAGYINMTLDTCDIKAAIDNGDINTAWDIVNNGRNAFSGAFNANARRFISWINSTNPGEQTYDMLRAYHGDSATWLFDKVQAAYDAGNGALLYGLISIVTTFKYCMHEFDAAWSRTVTSSELTNPVTGAPHAMNEAWAIFAGGHPDQCAETPRQRGNQLAKTLNIVTFGYNPAVLHMTMAFNDAWYAGTQGNTTLGVNMINQARATVHLQWALIHAQGMVQEVYASELYANCGMAQKAADHKSMAEAYWTVLAPYLNLRGVSSSTLDAVANAFSQEDMQYRQVRMALETAMKAIKINGGRLGTPKYSDTDTESECSPVHAPRA